MLPIHHLPVSEIEKIRMACGLLFSPDRTKDDALLTELSFDSLKKAFCEKAKHHHPDLHVHESPQVVEKHKERFIKIRESYETLKTFLDQRSTLSLGKRFSKPVVLAVGGAKGGIGKSMFSANLGVFLSHLGYRTVLVDLDLGGANLHLLLGRTSIQLSINDFLSQRVARLDDIATETPYGPRLIGGDGSRLGAANIDFNSKLKLLRAIRGIQADYIVLDLAAGTSYNIIDFFLAANHGLVLTTCDPSAYLDAYNFIRVSLFRKLTRPFGETLRPRTEREKTLIRLVEEATLSGNGTRVKTMAQLAEKVKKEAPQHQFMLQGLVRNFRPGLVINMAESASDVKAVVKRLQEATRKVLSIEADFLGTLPYHPDVRKSVRELVPIVARSPHGPVAGFFRNLVLKLAEQSGVN